MTVLLDPKSLGTKKTTSLLQDARRVPRPRGFGIPDVAFFVILQTSFLVGRG